MIVLDPEHAKLKRGPRSIPTAGFPLSRAPTRSLYDASLRLSDASRGRRPTSLPSDRLSPHCGHLGRRLMAFGARRDDVGTLGGRYSWRGPSGEVWRLRRHDAIPDHTERGAHPTEEPTTSRSAHTTTEARQRPNTDDDRARRQHRLPQPLLHDDNDTPLAATTLHLQHHHYSHTTLPPPHRRYYTIPQHDETDARRRQPLPTTTRTNNDDNDPGTTTTFRRRLCRGQPVRGAGRHRPAHDFGHKIAIKGMFEATARRGAEARFPCRNHILRSLQTSAQVPAPGGAQHT